MKRWMMSLVVFLVAIAGFADETTIKSKAMDVTIDTAFPRVIKYHWRADGAVIYGQENPLHEVVINDQTYTPKVSFKRTRKSRARYDLEFPSLKVAMRVELSVTDGVLDFRITKIEEEGAVKVKTIEFPNHSLISVRDTQSGAALSSCSGVQGDEFSAVGEKKPSKKTKSHAILNTEKLAATMDNNTIRNRSQLWVQTEKTKTFKVARIWNNYWRYRYIDTEIVELPWARVMITPDTNGDGVVDW